MPTQPPPSTSHSTLHTLAWAWAFALVVALLVSSQMQWSMASHGHDWWRIFLWQLEGWGFWAMAVPYLLVQGSRLAQPTLRFYRWMVGQVWRSALLITVHIASAAGTFFVLQPFMPLEIYTYGQSLRRAVSTWSLIDLLIYGLTATIGYGLESYRQARRAEVREARLETELAKAQLETLRLQLQPHFLFNSLHSIAALIRRQKSEPALSMLLGLSELLRATLETTASSTISLRDEIELLRRYVELQKTRFADRLTVTFDVPEACLAQPVPVLLLQPLVENAIRHGIAPRAAPGHVEIHSGMTTGGTGPHQLWIEVRDDGIGMPAAFDLERDAGVGLGNTRSRIQQIYGETGSFQVKTRDGGGTLVRLTLTCGVTTTLPQGDMPTDSDNPSPVRQARAS